MMHKFAGARANKSMETSTIRRIDSGSSFSQLPVCEPLGVQTEELHVPLSSKLEHHRRMGSLQVQKNTIKGDENDCQSKTSVAPEHVKLGPGIFLLAGKLHV